MLLDKSAHHAGAAARAELSYRAQALFVDAPGATLADVDTPEEFAKL